MSNWRIILSRVNVFIYRLSKGRLGSRMGGQSMLLLNTTGRKSGKRRTTSLSYYRDGDSYLVVASNWGLEKDPAWFHNLVRQPDAAIQVRDKVILVKAEQVNAEEYDRLWQLVTKQNSQYLSYQKGMQRRIPIVRLTPTNPPGDPIG